MIKFIWFIAIVSIIGISYLVSPVQKVYILYYTTEYDFPIVYDAEKSRLNTTAGVTNPCKVTSFFYYATNQTFCYCENGRARVLETNAFCPL